MKLKNKSIVGLDGTTVIKTKTPDGSEKAFTMRDAMLEALMHPLNDAKQSAENKVMRFMLAQRVYTLNDGGTVEIEVSKQEVEEIKRCVGAIYACVVVGFMFKELDSLKD